MPAPLTCLPADAQASPIAKPNAGSPMSGCLRNTRASYPVRGHSLRLANTQEPAFQHWLFGDRPGNPSGPKREGLSMRAAIVSLSVLLFVAPAMSQNYGAEIDRHVLVPCVRGMMTMRGDTTHIGIPDDRFLSTVKQALPQAVIDILHQEIRPSVAGLPYSRRMAEYRRFAVFCVSFSTR